MHKRLSTPTQPQHIRKLKFIHFAAILPPNAL